MDLQPKCVARLYTSESDVYRRQILTYKEGPRAERVNLSITDYQQVVVRIKNKLIGEATTIHWHGMKMKGTPWMDGASGVSQCPIQPGQTFTYR